MSDFTDEDVTAVREVLANYGLGSESTIHSSWRCFDKERYPEPCHFLDGAARDILAAVLPAHDRRVIQPYRDALAELRSDFQRIKDIAGQHAAAENGADDE